MHPRHWAQARTNHAATIFTANGDTRSYAALEAAGNRGSQLLRALGLARGDGVAIWCDNRPEYLEICWAAQRAGLRYTPISTRLTAPEAAYILSDCGARALIVAPAIGDQVLALAQEERPATLAHILSVGADMPGVLRWESATAAQPATSIADESPGQPMIYSSGTTGRPKGIRLPDVEGHIDEPHSFEAWHRDTYGVTQESIFLSPAPLYHTAPLLFCLTQQRLGATVVLMPRFDAEALLAAIAMHRVTHMQLVPTMFVRLLRLPPDVVARYDISSLRCVIHAGSPCPPDIKRAMIEWLGPIIHEYYGGTEGFGRTCISSPEWLERPGSVGRSTVGLLHVCGEDGTEVAAGEEGTVYFESDVPSVYHNDPAKTAEATHPLHSAWRTFGDIGRVDAQGYLTLTDRKAFMIISGGVNIYPQEAENILVGHPAVADVAVFGVPDAEMGEQVKAVVQLTDPAQASEAMAADLIGWCRERLSHYKCPRTVDFEDELPRHATGKLYKRQLRDRYWASTAS